MNFYETCALWFSPREECERDGATSAPTNISIAASAESIEHLEKCGVSKNEIDVIDTDGVINKQHQSICKDDDSKNSKQSNSNEKCNTDDSKNSSTDTVDSHGVGLTDSGGCTPLELFHAGTETRILMTPLLESVLTSSEIANKDNVKVDESNTVIITKNNIIDNYSNCNSFKNDENVNAVDENQHCMDLKETNEWSSNAEVVSVYESDADTEKKETENNYVNDSDNKNNDKSKDVNSTVSARKSLLLLQYHATHKMIKERRGEDTNQLKLEKEMEMCKREETRVAEVNKAHEVSESTCVCDELKQQEQECEEKEEEQYELKYESKVNTKLSESPLCPRPLDYDSPSSEQGSPTNKELSVHSTSFESNTITSGKDKTVNTNSKNSVNNEKEDNMITVTTNTNTSCTAINHDVTTKPIQSPLIPPCSIDAEDDYEDDNEESNVGVHELIRVQDTWPKINCNTIMADSGIHNTNSNYKSMLNNNNNTLATTLNNTNIKSNENKTKEIIKPGCNYDAPPFIPNNLLRLTSLEQEDSVIITSGNSKAQARSVNINNKRDVTNTKTINQSNNNNNRERNRSYYSRGEGSDEEGKFYNKSFKNYNNNNNSSNNGKLYNGRNSNKATTTTANNTSFSSSNRKRAAATSPSSISSLSALLTPSGTMRYWWNESNHVSNNNNDTNKSRRHNDQNKMKMLTSTNMGNEMPFQGVAAATSPSEFLSSSSVPLTSSAGTHADYYSEFSSFPEEYKSFSATRYVNNPNRGANSFTRRSRAQQSAHSLYNKSGLRKYNLVSTAVLTNEMEGNGNNYENDKGDREDEEEGEGEEDVIGLMDNYNMEWPYLYYMSMMNYGSAMMGTYDPYNGVWIPADDMANENIANMEGNVENFDGDDDADDSNVGNSNINFDEVKEHKNNNIKLDKENENVPTPSQVNEQNTPSSLSECNNITEINEPYSSFAQQKDTHNDSSHVSLTEVKIDGAKAQQNSHWSEATSATSPELIPPEPLEPEELESDNTNMPTINTTYSSFHQANNNNNNNINNYINTNVSYNNNINNNTKLGSNFNINNCNYTGHVNQQCTIPAVETANTIRPSSTIAAPSLQINPTNMFNNYMYNYDYNNIDLNNGSGAPLQQQPPPQLLTPFNAHCYNNTVANLNGSNTNSAFVSPPSVHLPSVQNSTSTSINVGELAPIQFAPFAPQPIDATEYQVRNLSLPTCFSSSGNSINSSFVGGSGRQALSQRWHRHDPYNLANVLPDNSYNTPPANSPQTSVSVTTPHRSIESPRLTRTIPSNVMFKFHDPIKRMSSLRLQKQE